MSSTHLPSQLEQNGRWKLIFNDDFDGPLLDATKWTPCYWWDQQGCAILSNNELEWYQPGNVVVHDGLVSLRALKQTIDTPEGTYSYTSGMISTGRDIADTSRPARFVFHYGYVEIRAKVPYGQGLWPAFWMLPADHNSKPEIDVMEILGHEPNVIHMTFHYQNEHGETKRAKQSWVGPNFSTDWHTFALDWQPHTLIWYVDGIERWRYTNEEYIPNEPMYLLINLAVGGDAPGPPDASTPFPSNYEIDYVRVWRREDQTLLPLIPIALQSRVAPPRG